MKALLTMYHGSHEAFRPVTGAALQAFADRHEYRLIEVDVVDRSCRVEWSKLPAIAAALREHDLVAWVDADVLVMDDSVDPASVLGPGHFLTILHDARYWISAAVFVLRACPLARRFVDDVWAMRHQAEAEGWPDAEQGAMQRLVRRRKYVSGVVLLGEDWFGPEGPGPDARIIHGCRQTAQTVPGRVQTLIDEAATWRARRAVRT